MKENKNRIISLIIGILIISLMVFPVSQGSAATVWEETFDSEASLDDWEFFGAEGHITFGEPFDPNFTIVDGALVAPYIPDWSNITMAFHNSTVATGTWSFDLFFPPHLKYTFAITFMFSSSDGDYFTTVGMTEAEYLTKMTGYGLIFRGGSNPRIYLISYLACPGSEVNVSEEKLLNSRLSESHHFDITRDTTGQFYVYHNYDYNSPIINYQCNLTSSSEKFGITSFYGSTWLDNITVSDTVDIPEPDGSTILSSTTTQQTTSETTAAESTTFSHLVMILGSVGVVIILRKKREE